VAYLYQSIEQLKTRTDHDMLGTRKQMDAYKASIESLVKKNKEAVDTGMASLRSEVLSGTDTCNKAMASLRNEVDAVCNKEIASLRGEILSGNDSCNKEIENLRQNVLAQEASLQEHDRSIQALLQRQDPEKSVDAVLAAGTSHANNNNNNNKSQAAASPSAWGKLQPASVRQPTQQPLGHAEPLTSPVQQVAYM